MTEDKLLRKKLKAMIQDIIDEISTTGNVAGYLTPHAFSKSPEDKKKRDQQMAKSIGFQLAENMYYEYRNDTSKLPHQKIGAAISEINRQLQMVEKVLKMNARLKKEYGIANERLWKRTQQQMTKLEGRLVEMARRLREMRG
jgi:hypothetical protein